MDYTEPSVFTVDSLVEAAIAQKGLTRTPVPHLCLLDPDGDLVRYLVATGEGRRSESWPCYHSDLYVFTRGGQAVGVVGCAVGAPYAVLIAEELFCLGCELLVSITSAGLLDDALVPPFFMLIERALRDEGPSARYVPPEVDVGLAAELGDCLADTMGGLRIGSGASWTTDAPFRETASRIALLRRCGATVVEMEAAALYAFAQARGKQVVCFAHVTNRLATAADDFDKGENNSSERMIEVALATWQACWKAEAR